MWAWMILLVLFGTALAGLTIFAAKRGRFGADESHGIQKVHRHWVPRLGGIPVFVTFVLGCWLWDVLGYLNQYAAFALMACSLPAFLGGLFEDMSRKAGIGPRLLLTVLAAVLGWFYLGGQIRRLDVSFVDTLLAGSAVLSLMFTVFAVTGVVHAINIIDGYNGLCGFFSLAAFCGIGAIAAMVGDYSLAQAALLAALSLIGFLFWNYPMGRLFLGDAGAYFIGFLIAEFSILLVARNPSVSPWCALLIVAYPVWETVFSMLRRASVGGLAQMGRADALHLHHLVYRRLIKNNQRNSGHRDSVLRNAMTTPYLMVLVLMCVIPAIFFSEQPGILMGFCLLFVVSYVFCYRTIVRLRVPRWLVVRRVATRWLAMRIRLL